MKQQITMFSTQGHDVLLEYDPATADMTEVNKVIDQYEKSTGGRAFSLKTGEVVDKATTETEDITIVRPVAGG